MSKALTLTSLFSLCVFAVAAALNHWTMLAASIPPLFFAVWWYGRSTLTVERTA